MNTKLGLALLSIGCAAAIGMAQPARADSFRAGWGNGWHHHSNYSVSLGFGGPAYYGGGYYAPAYYRPAYYRPAPYCFYDDAGYYQCPPRAYYPAYYGGGYYAPSIGISYNSGWGPGWGWNRWGGWRGGDRDDWRGRRGDHDGDGWRGHDHDHDGRPGGWDRGHFHNGAGNNGGGNHWHR